MKNYYSVKQASKLLGVSTNTVYQYIKEGKIIGKRIGRGRIKIPYKELEPFITPSTLFGQEEKISPEIITKEESIPKDLTVSETLETDSEIIPNVNDIVFYRILKGIAFLGLGFIYLLELLNGNVFPEILEVLRIDTNFVHFLLSLGIFCAGILNLLEVLRPEKFAKYHLGFDILIAFVLGYFSLLSFFAREYARFVFAAGFTAVSLGHLIRGKYFDSFNNFLKTYLLFNFYLSILGGIVLSIHPQLFPIQDFVALIQQNRNLFVLIWFGGFTAPLVYLLSPVYKGLKLVSLYILISVFVVLVFATELSVNAKYDIAYLSYIISFFGIFLVWWINSSVKILKNSIYSLVVIFIWIFISVNTGFLVLQNIREVSKSEIEERISASLQNSGNNLNKFLENNASVLLSFAGNPQTKSLIISKSEEGAIQKAKEIYERLTDARRVVVIDDQGIVLGVYPRNNIIQGANFSEREYFQKTLSSYKGLVSDVFEGVLGNTTVIQTEPVFENNKIIGILAISLSLESFQNYYQVSGLKEYEIYGVDEKGNVVFSNKKDSEIFQEVTSFSSLQNLKDNSLIFTSKITSPSWSIYLKVPEEILSKELVNLPLILTVILVVNSLISIFIWLFVFAKGSISEARSFNKPVVAGV